MKNRDIFISNEGNAWDKRCFSTLKKKSSEKKSHYIHAWERLPFIPKRVLEIGCSSGNKLQSLMEINPPPKFLLWY